jgi:hypothetical protein
MRIDRHHYCSHYGVSILKSIQHDYKNNPDFDEFLIIYKYVRMNAYTIGLSNEPTFKLRIYRELNFAPKNIKRARPDMFAPNWVIKNGFCINLDHPDWYNARIINVGIKLNYPIFKDLGNMTIGYDLHMYEEGKVIYDYVKGSTISFNEKAPWKLEHYIRIAQELNKTASLELFYQQDCLSIIYTSRIPHM